MAKLKGKLLTIFKQSVKQLNLTDVTALDILSDTILFFSQNDPSRTNKYVSVMVNIFVNEIANKDDIVLIIHEFSNIEHKLSSNIFESADPELLAQVPLEIIVNPKDIQNYESYKQLRAVITIAMAYNTKKDIKNKVIEDETDVIYNQDDYMIVVPLTFKSSCFWGVETKWCTTSREDATYFNNYTNGGSLFYVIDKYRQDEKDHPMSKFAVYIRNGDADHNAEIFNRPDHQMGRGLNRMLPQRLIDLLMDYHHNGGVISWPIILNLFVEYRNNLSNMIFNDDIWKVGPAPIENGIALFCDQFPSYVCGIKLKWLDNNKRFELTLQWVRFHEQHKTVILTHPAQSITNRKVAIAVKTGTFPKLIEETLTQIVTNGITYVAVKLRILDDIIMSNFKLPVLGWNFTKIKHQLSSNAGSDLRSGQPSITDLGCYKFHVHGDFADLMSYAVTAELNFTANIFSIYGGETDELIWEDQFQDFVLLYYNEIGLVTLIHEFQTWVIQTITTQSSNISNDLYDDTTNKIISKDTAFDLYLKSPEDVNKRIKPSHKSKQFFTRTQLKEKTISEFENLIQGRAQDIKKQLEPDELPLNL